MHTLDPKQTLAVLLGGSKFLWAKSLSSPPSFIKSARDIRRYLVNRAGIPKERVLNLFDSNFSPNRVLADLEHFLIAHTRSGSTEPATDVIIYYVGHGGFAGPYREYFLAVNTTRKGQELVSSIRMSDLAQVLNEHAAFLRRYLVLDCCFAASAYKALQAAPLTAAVAKTEDVLPPRGTALLCAAGQSSVAEAPEGATHTMFTGALLAVLRNGDPRSGPWWTLTDIGDRVREYILETYADNAVRPEVLSPRQTHGDLSREMFLFRNPAFRMELTTANPTAVTKVSEIALTPLDFSALPTASKEDLSDMNKNSPRVVEVPRLTSPDGTPSQGNIRVNGYKLFYHRANRKLTFTNLSRAAGLDRELLRKLEKVNERQGAPDETWFQSCDRAVLAKLEDVLDCHGKLQAGNGRPDDFLTQYMLYYKTYKGKGHQEDNRQLNLLFKTKVVVFDFDGTLTRSTDNRTTWEKIWVKLGYAVEDCFQLHLQFQQKKFSHQEWCNRTRDAFRRRSLREEQLDDIAKDIQLVDGVSETMAALTDQGIKIYIVSGSILSIIRKVLGAQLWARFAEVKANNLVFGPSGFLDKIEGTRYDFQGKAAFLTRIMEECEVSPSDVLYVGNSCNDIFASQSGARTLCVNPRHTNPGDEEHWTYAIHEMNNLSEILKYVQI